MKLSSVNSDPKMPTSRRLRSRRSRKAMKIVHAIGRTTTAITTTTVGEIRPRPARFSCCCRVAGRRPTFLALSAAAIGSPQSALGTLLEGVQDFLHGSLRLLGGLLVGGRPLERQ